FYLTSVRGTEEDPFADRLLETEIKARKAEFDTKVQDALAAATDDERVIRLEYVTFETGSANLTENSFYELDNLIGLLKQYPDMQVEVAGHTDNTGSAEGNQTLSQARADKVAAYLLEKNISADRFSAVGYGAARPIDSNDTEEGRAKNRRTEFKILTNPI
ncbi:MAG: OmpA family protein, partial [Bacteroidota bacterium]